MSDVTRRHWIVNVDWVDKKMRTCETMGACVEEAVMGTSVDERKSIMVLRAASEWCDEKLGTEQ